MCCHFVFDLYLYINNIEYSNLVYFYFYYYQFTAKQQKIYFERRNEEKREKT